METKSKFDGLIVKFNDISKSGHSDCSKISFKDKKYLYEVIKDLRWLAKHLEDSLSLGVVFHSTIDMAHSSLSLDSHILSKVSTFDN